MGEVLGRRGLFAAVAALAPLGCSGAAANTSDASLATTEALFTIEWSAPANDSVEAAPNPHAHASAYFLRLQLGADANLAARLVGASLVLPPLGRCTHVGSSGDSSMPLASIGPIDLVDVGDVTVEAPSARAVLAARAFPDVVDLVSGVLYTSRDWSTDALPTSSHYWLRASGSPALPPLAVEADAPAPPADVKIADAALGEEGLAMDRGDLRVAWRSGPDTAGADSEHTYDPSAGIGDVIYIDLVSQNETPSETVRCAFPDSGSATISAGDLPAGDRLAIAVHRVRREPFMTAGGTVGRVRFDLATTGTLHFRPGP